MGEPWLRKSPAQVWAPVNCVSVNCNITADVYITLSCLFCSYDVVGFSLLPSTILADQSHFLVSPCALCVPAPVRDYFCKIFSNKFPAHANVKCLLILLLLSGDIALNPGPINFGFVNCRPIWNKGPLIDDTTVSNNLDILALAETHIHISDTDSLLKSVTPPGFQLIHRPRTTGRGGGVGFLYQEKLAC